MPKVASLVDLKSALLVSAWMQGKATKPFLHGLKERGTVSLWFDFAENVRHMTIFFLENSESQHFTQTKKQNNSEEFLSVCHVILPYTEYEKTQRPLLLATKRTQQRKKGE